MRKYTGVEISWLAGLLEGEGSFLRANERSPICVTVTMTDKDIIEKIASWWDVCTSTVKPRKPHHKVAYCCRIRGNNALELMLALKPHMGVRRSHQIDLAVASHKPKGIARKISREDALKVRDRYRGGESAESLGKEFGVSKWSVYAIHQGRVNLG